MRKQNLTLALLGLVMAPLSLQAAEGLVREKSPHPAQATADKLANVITGKGFNLERISHSGVAAENDLEMSSNEVFIFGDSEVGTPLMKCAPTIGIDLPLKALVWEDEDGQVWIGYNDPEYLKERHEVKGCDKEFEKISGALDAMVSMTVAEEGTGDN